ncbi:MAG TPA: RNA polymerase subunit sigma-70 [Novosphingobium sp.]|nr:RNA polymerase subunit sigma-70 [Novosphingobium sp.]
MSASDRLEEEVALLRAALAPADARRPQAAIDRHMARLLRLIAPRRRHFIRAYGLLDAAEDAEQACAIALWRAILLYDPQRARFTTLLNWQLRGELQALRQRLRRGRGWQAVSLDLLLEQEESALPGDGAAQAAAEAGAAGVMARQACGRLFEAYAGRLRQNGRAGPLTEARLGEDRQALWRHLFAGAEDGAARTAPEEVALRRTLRGLRQAAQWP